MRETHIECAGAGKTYNIAKKIIEIIDNCLTGKKIYAITYTNYAVSQIKDEIKKQLEFIPDNVVIVTVDSFLLEHIIYPYSAFVKGEQINSCTIERLPPNVKWSNKRKRQLKDSCIIHSSLISQYAKSIIVPNNTDSQKIKKLKATAYDFLLSDIFCLFVDESQDMDNDFFDLMFYIIGGLDNYYFVGDPKQALWDSDQYRVFTERIESYYHVKPTINTVSRRVPQTIVPLCRELFSEGFQISSCSSDVGQVAYLLASELNSKERDILSNSNVFSIIKNKTDVFSTSNEKVCLTHEFRVLLSERYQKQDIDALTYSVIEKVKQIGLSACLRELDIRLTLSEYAKLIQQFDNNNSKYGISVYSIQKIKGLENDTVYFIICNSLFKILTGIKNDHNKETNLLYVALTRSKSKLLFIVNDDETMKKNFAKMKIDIETAIQGLGIPKAKKEDWFVLQDENTELII